MEPILELQNLVVNFPTIEGVVTAVNGGSYYSETGKTVFFTFNDYFIIELLNGTLNEFDAILMSVPFQKFI